jgi:cell division protein FtsI (penicillin-binding protein 3)
MIGLSRFLAIRPSVRQRSELSHDGRLHLEGVRKHAIDIGQSRLIVIALMFVLAFVIIAGRMMDVSLLQGKGGQPARAAQVESDPSRADVIDRNGVLLATDLPSASLYAHPKEVMNPAEAADKIAKVLPDLKAADILARLQSGKTFVYLQRDLTPRQEYEINALGIPGLNFEDGEKRVYPQGSLASQVVGLTDVNNKGVAGIEKEFDDELRVRHQPLRLSLDVRVQTVLHQELAQTMAEFHAVGAMGIVMDVHTGEVLGMSSLPEYDPNDLGASSPDTMFNRATLGVYEMGSTFKLFTAAAAIDSGAVTVNSTFDATHPLHVARFDIHDDHPQNRWLSVPEILIYSSNIGAAKMALQMGTDTQKAYLTEFGLTHPTALELPELGKPLVPAAWRDINTMTIAFGHGMAVTPLHMATGVSALVNGGVFHPPTLLARDSNEPIPSRRVIKATTSEDIRNMMRMIVDEGTGKLAGVPGYDVGGKTGTAEKAAAGGYRRKSVLASFISAFPISNPRYLVLAMIDEPHGNAESHGFITAGWIAAPTVGRVIAQIGPILGVTPEAPPADIASVQVPHAIQKAALKTTSDKGVAFAAAE